MQKKDSLRGDKCSEDKRDGVEGACGHFRKGMEVKEPAVTVSERTEFLREGKAEANALGRKQLACSETARKPEWPMIEEEAAKEGFEDAARVQTKTSTPSDKSGLCCGAMRSHSCEGWTGSKLHFQKIPLAVGRGVDCRGGRGGVGRLVKGLCSQPGERRWWHQTGW